MLVDTPFRAIEWTTEPFDCMGELKGTNGSPFYKDE